MRIHCTEEIHQNGGPGRFLLARAEEALDPLLAAYEGRVQLIYLDPPFGTGDTFHLQLGRGEKRLKFPVFTDRMEEGRYLEWMRTVLEGCHRLLSPAGSLYLHIDYRMSAKLRLMLDDIFGKSNFMNEIIWCYKSGGRSTRHYPRKHDTILFYRKSAKVYFHIDAVGSPRGPERRNHMKRFVDENGRICFSIRSGGKLYTYYEDTPVYPTDVWTDIEHLQQRDRERVGYGTQKPEALLRRILLASSRPGDLVMDLFSGSGTTAAAASKLGRRFVAVDASPFALYTLRARQLACGSVLSLLEGEHALSLAYPPDDTPVALEHVLARRNGHCRLSVTRAAFPEGHPLVYAALGTAEGERFYPQAVDCAPTLPLKLEMPDAGAPVLQLVDVLGHQAFFQL